MSNVQPYVDYVEFILILQSMKTNDVYLQKIEKRLLELKVTYEIADYTSSSVNEDPKIMMGGSDSTYPYKEVEGFYDRLSSFDRENAETSLLERQNTLKSYLEIKKKDESTESDAKEESGESEKKEGWTAFFNIRGKKEETQPEESELVEKKDTDKPIVAEPEDLEKETIKEDSSLKIVRKRLIIFTGSSVLGKLRGLGKNMLDKMIAIEPCVFNVVSY